MMPQVSLSTDPTFERPLYSFLIPFPVVCFVGAFATDLAYWGSTSFVWETFSVWLLAAGLVMAAASVVAGIVDLLMKRRFHVGGVRLICVVLIVVLSLVNVFIHSRDGYTAVVPAGIILSGVVVTLAGCDDEVFDAKTQIGANPVLPAPQQYLLPPMKVAKVAPWGKDTPTVAAGLQVHALATGLVHPRSLYVLPNGDVLIVESSSPPAPVNRPKDLIMGWVQAFAGAGAKGANRITLVREAKDGKPALRTVFLDHLTSPFGVALVGSDLYVADTDAVLRFPYREGDTYITVAGTKLTDLPGGPIDHHWTKSLAASPDGSKLYAGVGSNSNITENGMQAEIDRASVWEIDRKTGAHRLFATGLRNPNGLQFEPTSGALWAVVNERDEIGPNLVPDYFTSVKDGAFYGWPYSYYGQHVDPRVMPQRPDLVASAIPPDYALSSHVAPLGMTFYTGNSLPASYHGGAFIGEHGSWDRSPFNGYRVVFVPFKDGKPDGPTQDVVTGFLSANEEARGRPVGLAIDGSGALLIADDLGDTVWKVSSAR